MLFCSGRTAVERLLELLPYRTYLHGQIFRYGRYAKDFCFCLPCPIISSSTYQLLTDNGCIKL